MAARTHFLIFITLVGFAHSVERGFVYCPAYPCTCESKSGALTINCRNLYLSTVPKFLSFDGRIEELSLRHNSIQNLPANGFRGLHIEKLDLLDNAVSFIHPDAFRGLEHTLKALYIQLYALNGLPTLPLSRLNRLTTLVVVGCRQEELNAVLFANLTTLEELQLIGCRITNIHPGAFAPLLNLQTLVLEQNALRYQHLKEINLLDDLVYLDLSSNYIKRLDDMAFSRLSRLKSLKLAYNKMASIGRKAFYNLDFSLEELDLHRNEITENAIESFRRLKLLRRLDLTFNNISGLSGGYFTGMRYLAWLFMAYNDIKVIDKKSFTGLGSSLRGLDMHGNPLHRIEPGTFADCSVLERLNINNTNVGRSFHVDTFDGLQDSLKYLDISKSAVVSADLKSLTPLSNLTSLDLSQNLLTTLEFKVMKAWDKLEFANFSDNKISDIFSGDISVLTSPLSYLDLSRNNIQVIRECAFFAFKELTDVRLTGNPLECSCSLSWLYRWLQVTHFSLNHAHKWMCKFPLSLENVMFSELEFSNFNCPNSTTRGDSCLMMPDRESWIGDSMMETKHILLHHGAVCDPVCFNVSRPSPGYLRVSWSSEDRHIIGYNVILQRFNDSSELQSMTVSADVDSYTFSSEDSDHEQEICIVPLTEDLAPLAKKCKGVPVSFDNERDTGSRKKELQSLIHNSFLPLMFIYICGSLALAFIIACIIICIRRKRKKPKRVKPFYLAYPAWLDHRSSVSSGPLTHDPHFLNTIFNNDSHNQSSPNCHSQSTLVSDTPEMHEQYPDSPLHRDLRTTLSSRRDSRPRLPTHPSGFTCSTMNTPPPHLAAEILSGRSEGDDEFFFHF